MPGRRAHYMALRTRGSRRVRRIPLQRRSQLGRDAGGGDGGGGAARLCRNARCWPEPAQSMAGRPGQRGAETRCAPAARLRLSVGAYAAGRGGVAVTRRRRLCSCAAATAAAGKGLERQIDRRGGGGGFTVAAAAAHECSGFTVASRGPSRATRWRRRVRRPQPAEIRERLPGAT